MKIKNEIEEIELENEESREVIADRLQAKWDREREERFREILAVFDEIDAEDDNE